LTLSNFKNNFFKTNCKLLFEFHSSFGSSFNIVVPLRTFCPPQAGYVGFSGLFVNSVLNCQQLQKQHTIKRLMSNVSFIEVAMAAINKDDF
jgi:hypothetical protein